MVGQGKPSNGQWGEDQHPSAHDQYQLAGIEISSALRLEVLVFERVPGLAKQILFAAVHSASLTMLDLRPCVPYIPEPMKSCSFGRPVDLGLESCPTDEVMASNSTIYTDVDS